jgi:hypothetical protein
MAVVSLAGSLWTERHNIANCQDLNEATCYKCSIIYPHQTTFILDFQISPYRERRIPSFWVIPSHLNFMCRRSGTLGPFDLHGSCEQEEKLGRDC